MAYSCKQYAAWLLSRKDYAEKVLAEKLSRKYDIEEVQKTILFLKENGLLNDSKYSKALARTVSGRKSNKQIIQELSLKGISKEACAEALNELDSEEDRLLKKFGEKLMSKEEKDKLVKKLLRKGYNYSVIKTVLKDVRIEGFDQD